MQNIFISYRRDDASDATGRIADVLRSKFGENLVFKDVDSIPLGSDFRRVISDAVGRCDVLLAIIGDDWLHATDEAGTRRIDDPNDFVHIEIRAALDRDVPVIPVLVEGVKMARDRDLPESLRALAFRNAISVRSDPDFHNDMERLCRALTSELRKSSRLPQWPIRVTVAVVASMMFLLALGVAAYYFLTSAKRLEPVAPTRPDAVRQVEEKKALVAAVSANSTEATVATSAPEWLPLYPGAQPQGLSIAIDPQTGKRVGSYFFRTSDEIKQVHDFYEDKMTRAMWEVSRAPTEVWGSSMAEGREFQVTPQQRDDGTRVRVTFEEKKAGAAAAGANSTEATVATSAPDWLPLYPDAKPQGLSIAIDPRTGKRVGSYFFRTSDEIKQVHDFYEDKMTRATWEVSRAPTQVWGSSMTEGREFEVTPQQRGDGTRVRVTFEEKNQK
ncbi:MAG TPA: toll/interleukin-1 receptor domain-containing protein [Terrimicrobiaceae bacterium]